MSPKQAGRLEAQDARSAASHFSSAICDTIIARSRSWQLTLIFTKGWVRTWPRPSPSFAEDAMELQVGRDGVVDMQPLLQRGVAARAGSAPAQFAKVAWVAGGRSSVAAPLAALLRAAVRSGLACAASLGLQVCWAASQQLQLAVGMQSQATADARRAPMPPVRFRFPDEACEMTGGTGVDTLMAEYVIASASAIGQPLDFFIAADKGSIGCMNLQISLFGTNSNLAVVACPQVLPVAPHTLGASLAAVHRRQGRRLADPHLRASPLSGRHVGMRQRGPGRILRTCSDIARRTGLPGF